MAENALYQQMALTASSMAYSWSKWNNEVKEEAQILVQTAEQLEDEPLLEVCGSSIKPAMGIRNGVIQFKQIQPFGDTTCIKMNQNAP